MRLKLTENLNHNLHSEAARERDVSQAPDLEKSSAGVNHSKTSSLGGFVVGGVGGADEEQLFSDDDTMSPNEDEELDDEKPADAR